MAPTAFSLEAALQSLLEEGYFILEDAGVGGIVSEMEQSGFDFLSPYGLDYCKQHVLDNTRVRSILEALFERCSLGHWLRYIELPGHIECFGTGGFEAGLLALAVHQWPKGSTVVCWSGSHRANINTKIGKRATFETTQAALLDANCKPSEKKFPEGGLMIRDPRLCMESRKGYTITFMFATEELFTNWPKMLLSDLPELREKVANMESTRISMNFAFQDPAGKAKT
ncbi:uncharacterized protein K460DRAFT_410724 [Cucurbitaria berberidis CBS 394.84]|uniref:Uncharacterized protein n=1 Tax=Cucurbitaria berberidis CBS 394.84 TaxID=1168544 RepID=A0A9P4G6U7_9PLEO|nr:uncharacterized protein K460DRAFT_410724 [Cucurbitaria berberidis CBS 394.84]KAF1840118.1 hypothetical protein K460DRAFT_410724 [Cucurbitaria berberidis CBS 394.84]